MIHSFLVIRGWTAGSNAALFLTVFFIVVAVAAVIINASPIAFYLDAYYYFSVARNLVGGAGLTYDGVSITTGFHPIWMGVTTAVYYFFPEFPRFEIAIFTVQTILFFCGFALLIPVALRMGISVQAFLMASLLVFIVHLRVFQLGLENTLLFFLLSLLLWLHYRQTRSATVSAITIGIALVLIYFARLDSIFLLMIYPVWHFMREWKDKNYMAAVVLPIIVAASVLTHWLVMFLAFGTIFSTSQIAIFKVLRADPDILRRFAVETLPVTDRLT